jgi:chemotaxis-related protein WspD
MTHPQAIAENLTDDCWNRIGVWSLQTASCPKLQQCVHCRNCDVYSEAGRRMLERTVPGDYRHEWTQRFAEPERCVESLNNSCLMFRLGDEWLAINSHCVSEITQIDKVHTLPHRSDPLVKGLVNIRGELKICVSIGSILQLDKASEPHITDHEILERMILIEKDEHSFVFPVSEVEGILRYTNQQLRSLPATLANARSKLTTGIVPWNGRNVGILDDELLFYALARGLS